MSLLQASRIRSSAATVAFCLTLLSLAGCSGGSEEREFATVSGTITVAGQPLKSGRVNFHSDVVGAGAVADLDEDGMYKIDGELPVGPYAVYLTGQELTGQTNDQGVFQPLTIVPLEGVDEKYQAATSTDLTADLKVGRNTVDFALE